MLVSIQMLVFENYSKWSNDRFFSHSLVMLFNDVLRPVKTPKCKLRVNLSILIFVSYLLKLALGWSFGVDVFVLLVNVNSIL